MTPALRDYRHPNAGFTLPVPAGWETVEDVAGVALIAVEPERDGPWFRTNLVVTIERLAPPTDDLASWQDQALGLMRQGLSEFLLIDLEETRLGEHPARRTLAHHRSENEAAVAAVVMEQWTLVVGDLGYTLTASLSTLEYPARADRFAEVAAGFRPDPELAPA